MDKVETDTLAQLQADLRESAMQHIARDLGDEQAWTEIANLRAENARLLERIREAEQGAVAMRTELRPFAEGEGEGLDEVVIYGSHIVHAETMSDTALWIGIHDQAGGLVHIWVNAVRRKGRLGIVMTATDEGERGTIGQGSAVPATPLPTIQSEKTGGKDAE